MGSYQEFLRENKLSYSEANFSNMQWSNDFWEKIRSEKIAKNDFNFIGFEFPHFFGQDFHLRNTGNDRLIFNSANFSGARFRGNTDFSMITFEGVTNFENAEFLENTSFSHIWFKSPTYFQRCNFIKQLNIVWSEFYKECVFSESVFSKEHLSVLRPIQDFQMFHDHSRFSNIIFPSTFSFLYCDLSKVSFSGSYLKDVHFDGCRFDEQSGRFLVFDEERTFERRGTTIDTRHFIYLENVYREIRSNLEQRNDYYMAGKFYVSEMEMRRQRLLFDVFDLHIPSNIFYKSAYDYKGNILRLSIATLKWPTWSKWIRSILERTLISLYKGISNYGQSPGKVLRWLFVVFVLATFLLVLHDGYRLSNASLMVIKALTFQQDSSNSRVFVLWVVTFVRISSAILLPLFALSLRRIFKR